MYEIKFCDFIGSCSFSAISGFSRDYDYFLCTQFCDSTLYCSPIICTPYFKFVFCLNFLVCNTRTPAHLKSIVLLRISVTALVVVL